jgi:hypothetical protein
MRTRRAWVALVIALAAPAAALSAGAQTSGTAAPPPVTATGCEEHEAWVDGDAAAVAARLPKRYKAFTDANGAPLVFARAMRCQAQTVDGRTRPTTIADWGVVIDTPDGMGCATGTPGASSVKGDVPPICSWYMLGLVSDDEPYVDVLRQATPSVPAEYAPGLVYRLGDADGSGQTPFHFEAPG